MQVNELEKHVSKNISDYLIETDFCNFSDPAICSICEHFKLIHDDKTQLAKQLFIFARDHTKYRVGGWNKKASQTLSTGKGTCTNNTNLLVALFRKCGIPSGYGIMKVKGKEYFGPIVPYHLNKFISNQSIHVYCYVSLNNKWIKCDPSDDEEFALSTHHINPQSKLVLWDGENDAMLNLDKHHIIFDIGPLVNIDHIMRKRVKLWKIPAIKLGNIFIDYMRINGSRFNSIIIAEENFEKWLKLEHRMYFIVYSFLKIIKI